MNFLKKIKVAVHDGTFHTDDVLSVAILQTYLKKSVKVFRTRDPKVFKKMDYLLDVGREYNPKENKFDHHEEGWNEKRANGMIYATSGLLWKEFGEKITGSKESADIVDKKVIQGIDSDDNGIVLFKNTFEDVSLYGFSDFIYSLNNTYKEKNKDNNKNFDVAVVYAQKMLEREIKRAQDFVSGIEKMKKIYDDTEDKRIIVLDDDYSWRKFFANYPEPLFVIKPSLDEAKTWRIYAVGMKGEKFKNKMDLPESWAGKTDEQLQKITGVPDAIFCHNKRFMASAGSKNGAIVLAKLTIDFKG